MNEITGQNISKKIVIVIIMLLIALLHFVKGGHIWGGPFAIFWNGYMFDVVVPFGFYFLLCLIDTSPFKYWIFRGSIIFTAASCVEIAQYNGAQIFGSTFDPFDFPMYGIGVILAIIFDLIVFPRIFRFWSLKVIEKL